MDTFTLSRLQNLLAIAVFVSLGSSAQATIVQFDTVLGSFSVRLFDAATPLSSENFLNYVNDGDFVDSFLHRSVPGFILQGGGFTFFSDEAGVGNVPTDAPVLNEPGISNIRGTFAYAKQGGNPNSATSGWFSNLSNNTANLDNQNGGFTVFATILGNGMDVIDAIANLQILNAGGAFNTLPVYDYTNGTIFKENLVIVNSVTVANFSDGDYNFDGTVDAQDLGKWAEGFGRLQLVGGDYNDDKEITGSDFQLWQEGFGKTGAAYTDGDSNGDGSVNSADFLTWQRGYGSTTDVAADGNGDATVSGADFLLWQRDFGTTIPAISAIQGVPEPASFSLAGVASLLFLLSRRRCR